MAPALGSNSLEKLLRRATRTNQLDHLAPEFRRVHPPPLRHVDSSFDLSLEVSTNPGQLQYIGFGRRRAPAENEERPPTREDGTAAL
jgi:hypothetical protein